jgi:hypothetical protein
VFESRVLRGIVGPKGQEVAGDWRKFHNEELHDLYLSSNIIRTMNRRWVRWAEHVTPVVEQGNAYRFFGGKT